MTETSCRPRPNSSTIDQVNGGFVDIIIGTQLISKGHDFPNVTLVGILAPDQGLFSVDFRAPELLFQQLVQVSGRAGRGSEPGQVIIQTAFPENPYLAMVRDHRFQEFYQLCGEERAALGFPPFGYLAMLRAESTVRGHGLEFLAQAKNRGQEILAKSGDGNVQVMDPVASPMEKQSGRFRAQLLVKSRSRRALGLFLEALMSETESSPSSRRVRWSLDVDPTEMY